MMKVIVFVVGTFKFLCFATAAFMVGYWIYKYEKNEDLTLIKYKSLENSVDNDDIIYPEITFCFVDPNFRNDVINVTKEADFHERYMNYLNGHEFNESFKNLEYEKLTPNLFDHFENVTIEWKPGSEYPTNSCTDVTTCPYFIFKNSYNGFAGVSFIKCFGIEVKKEYASDMTGGVGFRFNQSLEYALNQARVLQVFFNYQNQLLRPMNGLQNVWPNSTKRPELFQITLFEILKRRNTNKNPCSTEWDVHDELVMKRHLENNGCRAPYHTMLKSLPVCDTKDKMKNVIFHEWGQQSTYVKVPCQEMPYIDYKHTSMEFNLDYYLIMFYYPRKAKYITQSREIDGHSLIGNIGGYIGLFLGKFLLLFGIFN